ncbi:DNA gyrase subunit A [compost metagenome]
MTTLSSSNYILDTSREYSIYVCENRAIPKVADGLKDAQRKALWLIRNKAEKVKTVSLAGEMIQSGLYLHGDASAAGSVSMLAAPFVNNVPLLHGIGTFGTRTAPVDGIGAPRYTYVKRGTALTNLMLPDLDIVPMKENYDGSTKEPVHFLPLIPTVLLNGISGIAVGWSTEILRRRFSDLVQASIDALDGKKVQQLIPHYERFDIQVSHIEDNSWEMSGRVAVTDTSTLHVTELPPDLTLAKFKERLNGLEDDGKINSYVDRSTKTIDITVKMQRGTVAGWDEAKAIDFLKLRQKKSERIVVVDWNGTAIKQYDSAEEVVTSFVKWRLDWFTVRYEYLKAEDEYSLNFWKAIKACFDAKLPAKLPTLANKAAITDEVTTITKGLTLDASQIDRIVSLPSFRWAKDAYQDVLDNIKRLEDNIDEYTRILADPKKLKAIYRKELVELSKQKF